MRRKMLALAAAVMLGMAPMTTGALARGHGGGHFGGGGAHFGGAHFGGARFAGGHWGGGWRGGWHGGGVARGYGWRGRGWGWPGIGLGIGLGLGGLYAYGGYPYGYCGGWPYDNGWAGCGYYGW